jgi:hypothetical protein
MLAAECAYPKRASRLGGGALCALDGMHCDDDV